MDIYSYLKRDHRKVKGLMNKVVKASRQSEREKLFLDIKKELELHSDPERDTFYKAIKKYTKRAREDAQHGTEEHEDIKSCIKNIVSAKNKDAWLIHFGELKSIVEHHIDDEESDIFKDAKKVLTKAQAVKIAQDMDALKKEKQESTTLMKSIKKILGKKSAKKRMK